MKSKKLISDRDSLLVETEHTVSLTKNTNMDKNK